ncbi:MAG TPA: hypothetical protein VF250_10425 [Conexibacter sp.]
MGRKKPSGQLKRGPFSGDDVSAALKIDGWYNEGGGGKHPVVLAHPSKPGKIPVKQGWTALRAKCPILKGIARTARLSDKRLLELLNGDR